ncbi:MAG: polyketide synthase dehydratase domain-containing protein [Thermodesulfobacteriota bacterium]
MEEFSEIADPRRLNLTIPISCCLRDHRFQGKAVLPAVEAMQVLAASAREAFPDLNVRSISNARFDKFLFIPPEAETLSAFSDLRRLPDGRVEASFITRTRAPKVDITRTKTHVTLCFGKQGGTETTHESPFPDCKMDEFEIPADRLYRDLVPFGPAYQNIHERVRMSESGTVAEVHAPIHSTPPGPLGSPFPLDAAFHAACAWGQRYAGVVAFPVGLFHRRVWVPTQPGEIYKAVVKPVNPDPTLLVFDIALFDAAGTLCEWAAGVRMRDVSGGRLRPPGWVVR